MTRILRMNSSVISLYYHPVADKANISTDELTLRNAFASELLPEVADGIHV